MEKNQYKEIFVSESKDHMDILNNSLVILEKEKDNKDIINQIFRSFHTLKGNAATMGYTKFSELAHHLETLLDLARNDKVEIDTSKIDLLFEGLDVLEKGVELIKKDAAEDLDNTDMIRRLDEISGQTNKHDQENKAEKSCDLTEVEEHLIYEKMQKKENVYIIRIKLENSNLKGLKTTIILKKINEKSLIIKTLPEKQDLANSNFSDEFAIIISTNEDKETIKKSLEQISKIKEINIYDYTKESCENTRKEIIGNNQKNEANQKKDSAQTTNTKASQSCSPQKQEDLEVKIDIKSLDNMLNLVGELLIGKMRLEHVNSRYKIKELDELINNISILSTQIQNEVIDQRMIPVEQVFSRFPRMMRDLSKNLGKEIDFSMEGLEIKLDRTVIDKIKDPLIHILRNSIDHGIEPKEDRANNGKNEKGKIKLSAKREKNQVIIEVEDDGGGIDTKKVIKKALEKKKITLEDSLKLTEEQANKLIFIPGMSTNETITEVSGRGVGMNVVETNIKEVGGNVQIASKTGLGTTITLKLPLTMAIITVLLVKSKEENYCVPLLSIKETIKLNKKDIKTIENNKVFILREETIPLFWLSEVISKKEDNKGEIAVIIEKEDKKIGLVVDSIISEQQILIKSLDDRIKKTKGIAGATILGNGTVSFILDIDTLISLRKN